MLGIINIVTLAAFAEAFSRDGQVRYGRAFLGRLVEVYLGKPVSIATRLLLAALLMLALCAYYIGVGTTIGDELPISPMVVAALMFGAALLFLASESLTPVISASLLVGAINIVLIVAIAGLSLPKLHPAYLAFADTPFYGHHHFYLRVVGLLVGVVLAGYFGHVSVGTCAATVLQRDPSGRTLLWGCAAAQASVMLLYILWVIAVNGAVPRHALMGDTSTSLVPLDAVTGNGVRVLGIVFVILAMGMASIHYSIGLRNTAREWLPRNDVRMVGFPWAGSLLPVAPLALVFLVTEWLLWRNQFSFSAILAYMGIAVVTILGGFLPLFLLVASRRKGDRVPGTAVSVLSNRLLIVGLYLVFFGIIVIHGLFIWINPEERVTAIAIAMLVAALTVWILRSGQLKPRLILEVRAEAGRKRAHLSAVREGRPLEITWTLLRRGEEASSVRASSVVVDIENLEAIECTTRAIGVTQMEVWVHADTPEADTEPFPATIDLVEPDAARQTILDSRADPCIIPITTGKVQTRISFTPATIASAHLAR